MMVKLPQLVFSTLFFNCNRSFFPKSYLRESYLPFMVNKRGKPLKAKIALICFNNAKPTKKKSTCILKMWFHFHRHYYEKVINKFKKKMVKKKKEKVETIFSCFFFVRPLRPLWNSNSKGKDGLQFHVVAVAQHRKEHNIL